MDDFTANSCGCCAGVDVATPTRIDNPPGQSSINYRAGVHASFKESLLARLSSADLPALAGLGGRDDADFTIALCDALASTLDVLTFYQERIANENFLRTATERRSILELSRLIGYELAPGVAASTYLAFTLQEVPGNPALAAEPVNIPVGSKVQSVPGPGQQPQTFETVEVVEARSEWNALPVQRSVAWQPRLGDTSLWVTGLGSGLQVGDVILVLGQERVTNSSSYQWDIRVLTGIEEVRDKQLTRLSWNAPLSSSIPWNDPDHAKASVFVFRQRTALFGHNAPDPRLIYSTNNPSVAGLTVGTLGQSNFKWKDFEIQNSLIDLDNAYPKITPGSWFALVSNANFSHASGLSGYVWLYRATQVSFPSRSDFGLSGKVTRITPDTTDSLYSFTQGIRENLVLAQSEALPVAARPLDYPLYGNEIRLERLEPDIAPGRLLAISGKRARIRLRKGMPDATVALSNGETLIIQEGQSLRINTTPELLSGDQWLALPPAEFGALLSNGSVGSQNPSGSTPIIYDLTQIRLGILDRDGREGVLIARTVTLEWVPAEKDDEEVQEIAIIDKLPTAVGEIGSLTYFMLSDPMKYCYDRDSTRINANVARATQGETVAEIIGSGDARLANQRFSLRQSPLTFVSANTPSGRKSTLELRANDLLWTETSSLYARGVNDRVYALAIDDEAKTTVQMGNGIEGALLPSGDHNIRATYRKGLGLAGNVPAGKLTNLLSRPLGVTGVSNPESASGGEDPERESKARANAPLTVLTLERAVSIRDYQDFARAFSGIAKAHALWIPNGPAKGVFLTVAGENGAEVTANSDTYRYLQAALQSYGDPLLPLRIVSYRDSRFGLRVLVKVSADADKALVLPAVEKRLIESFGFDTRSFDQGVSSDEVAATAQAVAGVEAVQVAALYRKMPSSTDLPNRLFAETPMATLTVSPQAAELLTLDAALLVVELLQ